MTTINSTNTPQLLLNGQYIAGKTGANPIVAQFVAGSGISISFNNITGDNTISCTDQGISTVTVTSSTQTIAANTQYICRNGSTLITFTLPTTAAVGDTFRIIGRSQSSGGWTIAQNAGQIVNAGPHSSTTGVTGTVSSTDASDNVTIICTTANTEFTCLAPQGTLALN